MDIVGFNITKIHAERVPNLKQTAITTNVEFTSIEALETTLFQGKEALKLGFKFTLDYTAQDPKDKSKANEKDKQGEIVFEGFIPVSLTKDEAKDLQKSWKKKDIPADIRVPIFNIIIRKCSARAVSLQEEIALPFHLPFPQITAAPNKN